MTLINKPVVLLFSIFFLFQLLFFIYLPNKVSSLSISDLIFIIILDLLVVLSLLFLYFGKLQVLSISLLMLIFSNFFTSHLDLSQSDLMKHSANVYEQFIIKGDVMPGFKGINTFSTDSLGFRSNLKINYSEADSYRIFAIGASTTEEAFLDDKETWTALLEGNLQKNNNGIIEVINTGVSGLRAKHNFSTLEFVKSLNPDLLIFLLGVNDWNHQIKFQEQEEVKDDHLDIRNSLLYIGARGWKFFLNQVYKKDDKKVREEFGDYYSSQNNSLERDIKKSLKIMSVSDDYSYWMNLITEQCKIGIFECMFITQPTAYNSDIEIDLKERLWMTPPNEEYTLTLESMINVSQIYNDWLISLTNNEGIYLCDVASELPPTTEIFYDDVHFNELGAPVVAQLVTDCIIDLRSKT